MSLWVRVTQGFVRLVDLDTGSVGSDTGSEGRLDLDAHLGLDVRLGLDAHSDLDSGAHLLVGYLEVWPLVP